MKNTLLFLIAFVLIGCGAGTNNQPQPKYITLDIHPYVAVGESGKIVSSYDGLNWKLANTPESVTSSLNSVTHNSTFFVAVGESNQMLYSIDGINWKEVSRLNNLDFNLNYIVPTSESNGFVAGGTGGYTEIVCNYLGTLVYGCEAISFNFLLESQTNIVGLAHNGKYIVAVGNDSLNRLVEKYKETYTPWSTNNNLSLLKNNAYSVFSSESKYVIASAAKIITAESVDFTNSFESNNINDIRHIVYQNGQYIGINLNALYLSNDIYSWGESVSFGFKLNFIANNESQSLIVGDDSNMALVTESGITSFKINGIGDVKLNSATIR